jgi:glycosylphosphatidylinositol transamidase (GPIT) subunit GPI8
MAFRKKLKSIALASSLFLTLSFTSCATSIVGNYRQGDVYKQFKQPKNKYAILISAAFPDQDRADKFLQDKSLKVYEGIKELGFSDDNIYFLATRGGEGMEKTDGLFTYHSFNSVCTELSAKMTKDDMLFFYFVGHGGMVGDSYVLLKNIDEKCEPKEPDNFFKLKTLKDELRRLKYGYAVTVIDACQSGHVAKALGKKNMVAISTTSNNQNSWISSEFSLYLIKALNGEKTADKNSDSKVSLEEAVYYATEKDPKAKKNHGLKILYPKPQIHYEEVDPSQVFLKE